MFRSPTSAAGLSVASNSLLIASKLAVGLLTGSISIVAEAIHSGFDLVASLIAFFSLRIAGKPADRRHPFGHGKFENISGAIEAVLIFAAVGFILFEAIGRMRTGTGLRFAEAGIAVMVVSVVVNILVSRHLLKVARENDSIALEADARHLTADVYTSLGVLAGLLIVRFTAVNIWDPIVAIGVALLIAWTAYNLTRKSLPGLVDVSLPPREQALILACFTEHYTEIIGVHRLRTRKSGRERYIDLHLVTAKDAHVADIHRLCDHLEADIEMKLPHSNVTIHVEPCPLVPPQCPAKCPLSRKTACQPGDDSTELSPK